MYISPVSVSGKFFCLLCQQSLADTKELEPMEKNALD